MPENLAYALIQLVHNFGAVAVIGVPAFALRAEASADADARLRWLVGAAWAAQIASGAGFGAVSLHYYGQLPDIHGVAVGALYLKIACAVAGLTLIAAAGARARGSSAGRGRLVWRVLLVLGTTALAAAAFLRWFS
jgi:hypothetical protein